VALALLGNKVACIDADIGLRNLDVVMGLENRIVYDLVDVVEGRARLRQAMIRDKRLKEDLYLVPAAQTRDKTAVSPSDMVRVCDELRPLVDFILIDSPAGIERGFRNAIAPADEVIIITNPEVSSVRDADRIIGLIEAEQKGPGQLVINRVKPDMVKRGDMLAAEDIIDILAIKLLGIVPEDELILISTNRGTPAVLDTDSRAGQAFTNIAKRLQGEKVPFMSLDEEPGFFRRLFRWRRRKKASDGRTAADQKKGADGKRKEQPAREKREEPAAKKEEPVAKKEEPEEKKEKVDSLEAREEGKKP
jgi:septum site-determining protein MinD